MLGKTEVRRRRGQQRIRWLDGITDSMDAAIKYRVSSPGGAEDSSGLLVLPRVGRVIDDTGRWF